jgi:hypothetical protein
MSKTTLKINYKPHDGQREALSQIKACRSQFITLSCGRGWGKTTFVAGDLVLPFMLANPGCQVMWVAPVLSTARTPIDEFFVPNLPKFDEHGRKVWEYFWQKNELHLYVGDKVSKIFFKSADAPDSIVSKGYHLIVVDEAALIKREVFEQQIIGCARKGNPLVVLISTPRGKNWFWEYWQRGLNPLAPLFASIHQPYFKRPDYPNFLVEMMKVLPADVVRQEYFAEFVDSGGLVFKGLTEVLFGSAVNFNTPIQYWVDPESVIDGMDSYILGWDLAKQQDYNVFMVMNCRTRKVVEYHRENQTDYKILVAKAKELSEKYNNCPIIYDHTGVGSGVSDFLSDSLETIPYQFTNESKNELINTLILSIGNKEVGIPNINTIRSELESFEFIFTRTGKLSYNAPAGQHDDTVIALALCNLYAREHFGSDVIQQIEDSIGLNKTANNFYDFIEQDDD